MLYIIYYINKILYLEKYIGLTPIKHTLITFKASFYFSNIYTSMNNEYIGFFKIYTLNS